ncbi:hypothetical protein [Virgibacillus sp. DJP39]|uniref:hypothetical protein n=1 Tax=Virgibacillus sp. DJP39 TaxID=3409790 RepID=UPI003BB4898E
MGFPNKKFKKEMDQYIGSTPLVTNKDTKRFDEWLNQPSIKREKRYIFPRVLTVLLLLGLTVGIYAAFHENITNFLADNKKVTLEERIADYPERIKEKIEKLPEEFKENMGVPTELPESYSIADFGYTRQPFDDPNGRIVHTSFIYAGGNTNILLNTRYGEATSSQDDYEYETVTLDNGIEAEITTSESSLSWVNKDGNHHILSLLVPPDTTDPDVTIEELIKMANSMD